MPLITTNKQLTLVEWAQRLDGAGSNFLQIAEVLTLQNDFLLDAVFLEGNDALGYRFAQRTSQPKGTFRKLNQGVPKEASTTKQILEPIALLESHSEIDEKLVDNSPDPVQARFNEDKAFLEGLGETGASRFIYGNITTAPEEFNGLAARLAKLSGKQVLGCGGTGADVTSIYGVQWGPDAAHFVYPRGSKVGLQMEDKGKQRVTDESGNPFYAWCTQFKWDLGICVKNPSRNIIRVANIETAGTTNILDEDVLIDATNEFDKPRNAVLYCNRLVRAQILKKALAAMKAGGATMFTITKDANGQPQLAFNEIPIRLMDSILNTEDAIAA
jgi:hypothetical protein